MNRSITLGMAMLVGAALGADAVQGLHAQAKPKAYLVTEIEVLDAAAQATYATLVQAAIKAAGARNFNTAGGKATAFVGRLRSSPSAVKDSLEQAQAYRNSSLQEPCPQRERHKSKYGRTPSSRELGSWIRSGSRLRFSPPRGSVSSLFRTAVIASSAASAPSEKVFG